MKNKLLSLLLVFGVAAAMLSGCGKDESASAQAEVPVSTEAEAQQGDSDTGEATISSGSDLIVATNSGIHQEILERAGEILEREGINLNIDVYEDYIFPNLVVEAGEADANYFQHQAYLDDFNLRQDMNLVSVGEVHFEPLGLYPGLKQTLGDLTEGDIIVIPEDRTNEGRALKLLENVNLLTLTDDGDGQWTLSDISENPYGLKIIPKDASMIPSQVSNAALLVINGNYARDAFYNVKTDSLAYENAESAESKPYWNVVAVNAGNEHNEKIEKLIRVLQSDEIKEFINSTYDGAAIAED